MNFPTRKELNKTREIIKIFRKSGVFIVDMTVLDIFEEWIERFLDEYEYYKESK